MPAYSNPTFHNLAPALNSREKSAIPTLKKNSIPDPNPAQSVKFNEPGWGNAAGYAYAQTKPEASPGEKEAAIEKPSVTFSPNSFQYAEPGFTYAYPAGVNRVALRRSLPISATVVGNESVTVMALPQNKTSGSITELTANLGDCTINGSYLPEFAPGVHELKLKGDFQTVPGNKLVLAAVYQPPGSETAEIVGQSEPFAVAAWPFQAYKMLDQESLKSLSTTLRLIWGTLFRSDSYSERDATNVESNIYDLDKVGVKEELETVDISGIFNKYNSQKIANNDFVDYTSARSDTTGLSFSGPIGMNELLNKNEAEYGKHHKAVTRQRFIFADERSGIAQGSAIEIPGSVYQWECAFDKEGEKWFYTIRLINPAANAGKYLGISSPTFKDEIKW